MVIEVSSAAQHFFFLVLQTVDLLPNAFQNLVQLGESFSCFRLLFAAYCDLVPQFFDFVEGLARLLDLIDFSNELALGLSV
jgi:hypothetical protein